MFLQIILFVIVAIVLFYLLIKGLNKLTDRQQQQIESDIYRELRAAFSEQAVLYSYDKKHQELDSILSSIVSNIESLFRSSRTERFVVEGVDSEQKPFIAAVIKHGHHQSSGSRDYTFLYAVKGKNILSKQPNDTSIKTKQINDWAVVFMNVKKLYQGSQGRFLELKKQLY